MRETKPCQNCGADTWSPVFRGIRDWEFGAPGEFSYLRCDRCRLVRLEPFPALEDLVAAYPASYTAFADTQQDRGFLYSILSRVSFALFRRSLRSAVPEGARVLDVGCGNGEFLARLRALGARFLHGVDFHEKAVALARKKGVEAFHGVFVDYREKQGEFDAIFMINYLEHVLNPRDEAAHAFGMLRAGGSLIGEMPNFRSIDRLLFGRFWGGNHIPRHTFQFDPDTLKALLLSVGFRDVAVSQDVNPGHIVISIQNFLQRNVPDLSRNPKLRNGRMAGFNLLLLLFLPFNVIFAAFGLSGVMKFRATR